MPDDTRRLVVMDFDDRYGQTRIAAKYDAALPLGELRERIAQALSTASGTKLTRYETVPYADAVLRVLLDGSSRERRRLSRRGGGA